MKVSTLFSYNILPRRVDKKIAILSTNGAVTFVDFILGEWVLERHSEANCSAVAVCFVGCWVCYNAGLRYSGMVVRRLYW
jgi:hypothetical protein